MTSLDFRGMFDAGWSLRATVQVAAGGGQALWSITSAQDPGWGVPNGLGSMNGFVVDRVGADELRISLWRDPIAPVLLGPGSADVFHTLELRGAPGSPLCELFIDGVPVARDIDLTGRFFRLHKIGNGLFPEVALSVGRLTAQVLGHSVASRRQEKEQRYSNRCS